MLQVLNCARKRDYHAALQLLTMAGAVVDFDKKRVKDVTSHQVGAALNRTVFQALSHRKQVEFQEAAQVYMSAEASFQSNMCNYLRQWGPPQHDPSYMINHGMGAFLERDEDPLVRDFNTSAAWNGTLRDWMKCG